MSILILLLVILSNIATVAAVIKVTKVNANNNHVAVDSPEPYLQLLGSIPEGNFREFMQDPEGVARALGIIVDQRAIARYEDEMIKQFLESAQKHQKEKMRLLKLGNSVGSPAVTKENQAIAHLEAKAREFTMQQRVRRQALPPH